MSKNLKEKVRSGERTIGSWLTIPHVSVVEIMATAGFDWIAIDIEHSAINIESIQLLISAIQGNGMKAFVRVFDNDEIILKRVLDAGADGVIVPMIKNKSEALKMIDSIYYPPLGKRGVGLNRAQNYGIGFKEYQEQLKNEIVVIAQIEHIDAIENLEEILDVDQIDATLIGPYDLSASMGYPGDYNRDDVKEALKKYELICEKRGKTKGAHVISSDSSETKAKVDLGYSFLAFSLDFFFLGDKAREEMVKLRKSI